MNVSLPQPPRCSPLPNGGRRPLWSVMIPAFNCAKYLRITLASVLSQDPGPDAMQIEVVDDCSTRDDPEAVVREVGRGRVSFFRKQANAGATANFNTCIDRSVGDLVHILHGDDVALPGFYERMAQAAAAHPDCALIACRTTIVDEQGIAQGLSGRVPALESGGRDVRDFLYRTPLFTPGVVVRRGFYESHGGFLPELFHTADWEMWCRAVAEGGGVVLPEVLAQYREFAANDTARLKRTADNFRDMEKVFAIHARRHPEFEWRRAHERLANESSSQAQLFGRIGDAEAYAANNRYYRARVPWRWRLAVGIRGLLHRVLRVLP